MATWPLHSIKAALVSGWLADFLERPSDSLDFLLEKLGMFRNNETFSSSTIAVQL